MSCLSSSLRAGSQPCAPDNVSVWQHRSSAGAARRISRPAPGWLHEESLVPISVGHGRDALDGPTPTENGHDGSGDRRPIREAASEWMRCPAYGGEMTNMYSCADVWTALAPMAS